MVRDEAGYSVPHNNRDTSKAAAEKAAGFSASLRHRAYLVIRARGLSGATCEEVEQELATYSHQSISARLWELAQESSIFDSLHRRLNRSESEAIVWMHNEVAAHAIVAPYLAYQSAQNTLEVLRKVLSTIERAAPLMGTAELEHLDALKSFFTERRHELERIPEPPPFPCDVATPTANEVAAEEDAKCRALLAPPGALFHNGKEVLL